MTDRLEDVAPGGNDHEPVRVYEFDPDESASFGVVTAVSDATRRPTASLEPLANAVDTDALEALVGHVGPGTVRVSFEYAGVSVTVDSTRTLVVRR